jgi:ADP-L-glycero-D-manno-heptose 6-epimerase
MIIVTGAYGFIGSCMVQYLNEKGHRDIVVVDDFYKEKKEPNLAGKRIREWIHRDIFQKWFSKHAKYVDVVFHLGARTDTTSHDKEAFDTLNLDFSKEIWKTCTRVGIPLIYASSAATYGDGEHGYTDDHEGLSALKPMNLYAESKHQFDLWAIPQKNAPPRWAGLKFFNVYGPNEYHKGRMASVVWHGYRQIEETGVLKLFKSHKKGIKDGHQQRDFIYVKDITDICLFFFEHNCPSGIYNAGTGEARTFLDLGKSIFAALDRKRSIDYIPTPENIRDTYQYYTQADMTKLRGIGYQKEFTPLEEGVKEYVQNFLVSGAYY